MTLNFFPYYEELLANRNKFTTLRLGDRRNDYRINDLVDITVGWGGNNNEKDKAIAAGKITFVDCKPINKLTERDLEGESPDCRHVESVKYVLGSIYRSTVKDSDLITIIKWRYV